MRYADEQLTRPRVEHGCDFGSRRAILVRNGKDELIHQAGHKYWGGIGQQAYSPSQLCLYGPKFKAAYHYQKDIHKGRIKPEDWERLAPQIHAHLGAEFPIELISLKHTLLLDEPGEVSGPPAKAPPKKYPRVAGPCLYRVIEVDDDDQSSLKVVEYPVVSQAKGRVTYKDRGGCDQALKVEQLADRGYSETRDGALDLYLDARGARIKEHANAVLHFARRYAASMEAYRRAREEIKALRAEST